MSFLNPKRDQWGINDLIMIDIKCKTKRRKKLSNYNTNQRNCKWTRKEFPKTEDRLGTCKVQSIVYLGNHVALNPTETTEERRNKFYHQHITIFQKTQGDRNQPGLLMQKKSQPTIDREEECCKDKPRETPEKLHPWNQQSPSGPGASRQGSQKGAA